MKTFLSITLTLLLALSFALNAQAQNKKTLKGKIVNGMDNTPLENVSVRIKGTTMGTLTDANGNYEFDVQSQGAIALVFSAKGFIAEEATANNSSEINVFLFPDTGKGKRSRKKFLKKRK